jgi:DNA-binding transcriptional regulator YhcF (GntR family)
MTPRKRPSLVEQVRDSLLGDLTSGKLEPGAKLANENDLAERYGVSRSTIREAVGGLMDAGYLARRHGSGTYVTATPRTRHPLETTVSYTAMIRASGHKPAETVVSKAVRDPDQDERALLGLVAIVRASRIFVTALVSPPADGRGREGQRRPALAAAVAPGQARGGGRCDGSALSRGGRAQAAVARSTVRWRTSI